MTISSIASELKIIVLVFLHEAESLIKDWNVHDFRAGRAAWNIMVVSGFKMTELGGSASLI